MEEEKTIICGKCSKRLTCKYATVTMDDNVRERRKLCLEKMDEYDEKGGLEE